MGISRRRTHVLWKVMHTFKKNCAEKIESKLYSLKKILIKSSQGTHTSRHTSTPPPPQRYCGSIGRFIYFCNQIEIELWCCKQNGTIINGIVPMLGTIKYPCRDHVLPLCHPTSSLYISHFPFRLP